MDEEKVLEEQDDFAAQSAASDTEEQEDAIAKVTELVDQALLPVTVVDVQFRPGAKVYFFDPGALEVQTGEHVIIETARGPEYGVCTAGNHTVLQKDVVQPLRGVIRLATPADEQQVTENRAKEKRAFSICLQKIAEHKLEMQLVSAEYAFDGSKILFFFTADERVDFRELVKNLAGIFRTRIELRQIGVRDKAKMVGGLGICGRPFCCAQFLDDFQPVSIKMAKTQNLSLNPTKISGTCGRLMCCLKYEQDAYEDLLRTSPKMDSFVDTPDGRGTVVDVNLLRQNVRVRMEEEPDTIETYKNCDICVLRSGKAKKNDPPIPADQAPLSGNGKRKKPVEPEQENHMHLDPIRFRYRPDDIVEETPADLEQEAPAASRRRKKRSQPERQEQTAEAPVEKEKREGETKDGGNYRKNRNRRPNKPEQAAGEQSKRPAKPQGQQNQRPHGNKQRQNRPAQSGEEKPVKENVQKEAGTKENTGKEGAAKPRNNYRRYHKPRTGGPKNPPAAQ